MSETGISTKVKSDVNIDKMTMKNLCSELNQKMAEMTLGKESESQEASSGDIPNNKQKTGVGEGTLASSMNKFYEVNWTTNKRTAEWTLEKEGAIKRPALGDITNRRVWEGPPAGARNNITEINNDIYTWRKPGPRKCDMKQYYRPGTENNVNINFSPLVSNNVLHPEVGDGTIEREVSTTRPIPRRK